MYGWFSFIGQLWEVDGTSKEEDKIKSISVQKMENSVLLEWGLKMKTFFVLSQSMSAPAKLSNCSSDRTTLFLSAMFKIALIANKVQIK